MLSARDTTQNKRSTQAESEGLGKNTPSKWTGRKARVAILISDKIDFKTKAIKRDKECHYIILKGVVHQEYITLVNIYASNIGVCWKYTKIYKENLGGLQERH